MQMSGGGSGRSGSRDGGRDGGRARRDRRRQPGREGRGRSGSEGPHRPRARIGARNAQSLKETAQAVWDQAYEAGREHGYRNAQVTVIAGLVVLFVLDKS